MQRVLNFAIDRLFDLIDLGAIAGFVGMLAVWAIILRG